MKVISNSLFILPAVLALGACSSGTTIGDPPAPQRLILETITESDGQVSVVNYEYDDNNNIAREFYGEAIREYQVDGSGRVLGSTWDGDGDGNPEYRVEYLYNADGNLFNVDEFNIRREMYESVYVLTYENGLAISLEEFNIIDVATSSEIDLSTATISPDQTYTYENGRLAGVNDLYFLDGSVVSVTSYSYGPDGTVNTVSVDDVSMGNTSTSVMEYETADCNRANYLPINQYYCVK